MQPEAALKVGYAPLRNVEQRMAQGATISTAVVEHRIAATLAR